MMHIIYAVMAISLICLVAFGGVSYMNPDAPIRAVASRGLVAQYEAIHSGINAYRSVNNGVTPDSIDQFRGFLPHGEVPSFGEADKGFKWSLEKIEDEEKPVLCLDVVNNNGVRFEAAMNFAQEIERRTSAEVSLGDSCGLGSRFGEVPLDAVPEKPVFTVRSF